MKNVIRQRTFSLNGSMTVTVVIMAVALFLAAMGTALTGTVTGTVYDGVTSAGISGATVTCTGKTNYTTSACGYIRLPPSPMEAQRSLRARPITTLRRPERSPSYQVPTLITFT